MSLPIISFSEKKQVMRECLEDDSTYIKFKNRPNETLSIWDVLRGVKTRKKDKKMITIKVSRPLFGDRRVLWL